MEPVELRHSRDVEVPVRDGVVLRADVFRGADDVPAPVILTMGPYGKDVHFEDFNAAAYATVEERGPLMNWETVNPQWWVPAGYVVVRVDQRGTGASPGVTELQAPQEHDDLYDCVEWAAAQPWSTGRVALMGISYYAMNQWHVAAMRPPGLAAIVPWEGAVDLYREWAYHGGILSNAFTDAWWPRQITGNLHAGSDRHVDLPAQLREHPLLDDFYADRRADLTAIEVPVLSAGNWGGFALHLRGNVEGYLAAGTSRKWLEIHAGNHFAPFYSSESRAYQKRFLDHWVAGTGTGWDDEPPVRLFVRTLTGGSWRYEQEWPIARTRWTGLPLDAGALSLGSAAAQAATTAFDGLTGGVELLGDPAEDDVELTGPSCVTLWLSSTATDADVMVTVDVVGPDGVAATFEDASGMPGPVTKGWLRASHRALDPVASTPYRPVHTHVAEQPLEPGVPVRLEVEIAPTSVVVPAGHRLRLRIAGHDRGEPTRFGHDDPVDRDPARFGGTTTLHTGPAHPSAWLVPVIPSS